MVANRRVSRFSIAPSQIDALEELKDAYGDIIDLRKEALDAAKEEAEYEDKVSENVVDCHIIQLLIAADSLFEGSNLCILLFLIRRFHVVQGLFLDQGGLYPRYHQGDVRQ